MTQEHFKTKDLALAAFLSLQFSIVDEAFGVDQRSVFFSFERTKELNTSVFVFLSNEASVEPNAFFGAIHEMKMRIAALQRQRA